MAEGFPLPDWFIGDGSYFGLEKVSLLEEYEDRLVIDWGKATRAWHQRALLEKEIINNREKYDNWHTALAAVYAIYLIVDILDGKHYVGSAYGRDGLLQR